MVTVELVCIQDVLAYARKGVAGMVFVLCSRVLSSLCTVIRTSLALASLVLQSTELAALGDDTASQLTGLRINLRRLDEYLVHVSKEVRVRFAASIVSFL
jgi:hypothetical protein